MYYIKPLVADFRKYIIAATNVHVDSSRKAKKGEFLDDKFDYARFFRCSPNGLRYETIYSIENQTNPGVDWESAGPEDEFLFKSVQFDDSNELERLHKQGKALEIIDRDFENLIGSKNIIMKAEANLYNIAKKMSIPIGTIEAKPKKKTIEHVSINSNKLVAVPKGKGTYYGEIESPDFIRFDTEELINNFIEARNIKTTFKEKLTILKLRFIRMIRVQLRKIDERLSGVNKDGIDHIGQIRKSSRKNVHKLIGLDKKSDNWKLNSMEKIQESN